MKQLLILLLLLFPAAAEEAYRKVRFVSFPNHAEIRIGQRLVGYTGEWVTVQRELFANAQGQLEARTLRLTLPHHAEVSLEKFYWDQLQEGKVIRPDFDLKPDHLGIFLLDHRSEFGLLLALLAAAASAIWLRSKRTLLVAQDKLREVEVRHEEVQEDLAELATRKELDQDHWLGRTVGGYHTLKLIGRGAQGAVYRARCQDGSGPELAALKISISPSDQADDIREFKARIQREYSTPSRVHSPFLLRYFGVGDVNETTCYLVMELIEGGMDLHKWSLAHPEDPLRFLTILQKAARGLAQAHAAQILHRDLKPENILVTPDLTPKIADFGCALDALRTRLTQGDKTFGTPIFMAPEVCCQEEAVPASDQYSLGVIAYAYFNQGRVPHRAALDNPDFGMAFNRFLLARIQEPAEPIEGVSDEVNQCLARMLALRPENRFPDVASALDQLVAAFSGSQSR